jgi:ribosomal protein L37AE/L43A
MMYGNTKIIFVNAKQAKTYYNYKNNKRKMYRINAAIWYNKKCKINGITPNYINIKVNGNNKQSQRTKETAIRYRINQEIKFLHNKKRYINHQLYEAHLTGTIIF